MLLTWIVSIFFLGAVKGDTVCISEIKYFDKSSSNILEAPASELSLAPDMDTQFLLSTRSNPDSFQVLSATDPSTISPSNFQPDKTTRFVVHGYNDSSDAAWVLDLCKKLHLIEDGNCIAVDWRKAAREVETNVGVVGVEIGFFVNFLKDKYGLIPGNTQIIGHGLGAHVAGVAGKSVDRIDRITGLDPTVLYFQNKPKKDRLDPSDATLVDVIYTNSGSVSATLGTHKDFGHLNFNPNGGAQMPGCPSNNLNSNMAASTVNGLPYFEPCSHMKAVEYYIESIGNPDIFTSYPCFNWLTYLLGVCKSCPGAGCPKMGHHANTYAGVTSFSQDFYLTTS